MTIDDATIREVADAAEASAVSVTRRIAGLPVRGRVAKRIDRELANRGLLPGCGPVPAPEPAAPTDAPPVEPTRQGAT